MPRIRSHPGEILLEEYLRPLGMSANALAKAIEVPANRISELLRGRRGMTADTACRLGRFFGTTPEFWMSLQTAHDLSRAVAEHDYSTLRALESA
ncbi:HigA family addiction module antitoxin [Methylorubrum sp. SL192]|uniref:HigA family addiction module antitoxin n=1 Tax=Methylorubrum sp. SL192 TaxID=2995167 RepID=UPI002276B03F|nr:HigA family addiction module antitoxin [Methylorubrum sp. SL192]MCY1641370.1 HigA family addiction module antitoxin [Methylorubrum sp. SL192]